MMDNSRLPQLLGQALVVTMDLPLIEVLTATAMGHPCYSSASCQPIDEFEQRSQVGHAADTFRAAAVEAKGQNRSAVRLARPAALNEWRLLPSHADNIFSASFRSRSQNYCTGRSTCTHTKRAYTHVTHDTHGTLTQGNRSTANTRYTQTHAHTRLLELGWCRDSNQKACRAVQRRSDRENDNETSDDFLRSQAEVCSTALCGPSPTPFFHSGHVLRCVCVCVRVRPYTTTDAGERKHNASAVCCLIFYSNFLASSYGTTACFARQQCTAHIEASSFLIFAHLTYHHLVEQYTSMRCYFLLPLCIARSTPKTTLRCKIGELLCHSLPNR